MALGKEKILKEFYILLDVICGVKDINKIDINSEIFLYNSIRATEFAFIVIKLMESFHVPFSNRLELPSEITTNTIIDFIYNNSDLT